MKKLILLSVIGFLLIGCESDLEPIASFKVVPENPKSGQTIQLVNNSVNSEYYMWSNGNNNSSTKDWSLILGSSGKYTITLQVWNKGKTKTDSKTVVVSVP